jgi:hypothetical protein
MSRDRGRPGRRRRATDCHKSPARRPGPGPGPGARSGAPGIIMMIAASGRPVRARPAHPGPGACPGPAAAESRSASLRATVSHREPPRGRLPHWQAAGSGPGGRRPAFQLRLTPGTACGCRQDVRATKPCDRRAAMAAPMNPGPAAHAVRPKFTTCDRPGQTQKLEMCGNGRGSPS